VTELLVILLPFHPVQRQASFLHGEVSRTAFIKKKSTHRRGR